MQVRRKLSTASFSFASAVFLAQFLPDSRAFLLAAALCAALSVAAALSGLKWKSHAALILAFLSVGLLWRWGWYSCFISPAQPLDGQTLTMQATVLDYSEQTLYGGRVVVSAQIPGDRLGRGISSVLYFDDDSLEMEPGDQITVLAEFSLPDERADDDAFSWYRSRGVFAKLYQSGELSVSGGGRLPVSLWPAVISRAFKVELSRLFTGDTGAFIRAVTTGDRSLLSESFSQNLAVAGLSHVAAASGMHVAFLVGLFAVLIPNKKKRLLLILPAIFLFMAITGFTPSIVRAGIMQTIVLLAPVLRREADAYTSLGFALFVILLVNPYAVYGASLQLSFACMLGIFAFSGRAAGFVKLYIPDRKNRVYRKVTSFLVSVAANTFSSMVFTLPIIAYYFGTVSIISPLTNLLSLWAVSFCFMGAMLAVTLGFLWLPLGLILAWPVRLLAAYVVKLVGAAGHIPFASAQTDSPYVLMWLLYVYVVLVIYAAYKLRSKGPALSPADAIAHSAAVHYAMKSVILTGALFTGTFALTALLTASASCGGAFDIAALDVGQGQCVIVTSGAYTAVLDCGGDAYGDAGAVAVSYLRSLGRNRVDIVFISHYHEDHTNGLATLMESMKVDLLVMPDIDELSQEREEITMLAAKQGTQVVMVSQDTDVKMGSIDFTAYAPNSAAGDENERCMALLAASGNFEMLTVGDMDTAAERALVSLNDLPDIEVLIAGHHGSKYSSSDQLLEEVKPEIAVICVGENSYGHPTQEAMARLSDAGAQIYRTDRMGTVKISSGLAA